MKKEVCLVTGASSGLGRALAETLCDKGYLVYVTARREKLLQDLKESCKDFEGEIKIVVGDLTDEKFRNSLIRGAIQKEGKIDYLFNNAGFGRAIKFEDQNVKEIRKMFEVNVVAYEHLASITLKEMKKAGRGRIINVGSVVAFTPLPYFTTYNATKSAVYAFNRSLRYELRGLKVTTTVVLPARMKTGFADKAYDCYSKKGRGECVKEFNKIAGSPYSVARKIVQKMDSGKEVILPTFKSFLWYSTRYVAFIVDFMMKNLLGPKQLNALEKATIKPSYKVMKGGK